MTHPQFRTEEKVNLLQNILGPHKYIFSPPTEHESSFNDLENSQYLEPSRTSSSIIEVWVLNTSLISNLKNQLLSYDDLFQATELRSTQLIQKLDNCLCYELIAVVLIIVLQCQCVL